MICAAMVLALGSCIENDLSYPDVKVEIVAFELDGMKDKTIDYNARSISIILSETAEISAVKVTDFRLNDGATFPDGEFPQTLDLRKPYKFRMKMYEVEDWVMIAAQPIDRYIRCDNQIGEAILDVESKTAYVTVVESQPLNAIRFTDVKLEPEGSVVKYTSGHISENGVSHTVVEECNFPMVLDCSVTRKFHVEYKDSQIEWSVTFLQQPVSVEMKDVNAWTYSADVQGITDGNGTPVFEYRESSAQEWITMEDIAVEGTVAYGTIVGLAEDTEYCVRIGNGTDVSNEMTFRTGKALQLENMNFETWHQADPNDCWYPFPADETSGVWGTANPGTNFLNAMNPTRPEYSHVATPGSTAVRLESMTPFGVFAAGNIFTGKFNKFSFSDMTAYLEWGTPFTGRPYSLKGYLDYAPVQINKTQDKVSGKPNPHKDKYGLMDHLQILAVLVDEAENEEEKGPFPVVSSKPGEPDLKNDSRVIAFGTIESSKNTGGQYEEFECVLEYKDNRSPDYVIVVACSSLWGNFFTGGIGSVLYVDDFWFEYK